MILGMSTSTFTLFHVILSLIGIGTGLGVVYGLIKGKNFGPWVAIFLATTAATSLSGFAFPFEHLLPSHILGILSLIALAVAVPALYVFHLAGNWRRAYILGSCIALYFNVFVLVAQLFQKVPALHALAPTGKEPAFGVAQLVVVIAFVALTIYALKGFRAEPVVMMKRAA